MFQKSFKENVYQRKAYLIDIKFTGGRKSNVDDPWSGRSSNLFNDQDIDKVREIVLKDCCITIRDIIEQTSILFSSCQAILKDDLG